jgi:hypothetical protein
VLDDSNFALKKDFWKFQFSNAHTFFDPSTKIWYFELMFQLFELLLSFDKQKLGLITK